MDYTPAGRRASGSIHRPWGAARPGVITSRPVPPLQVSGGFAQRWSCAPLGRAAV